jgi:hypothetical protein
MHIYEIFSDDDTIAEGDIFAFDLDDLLVETTVVGFMKDGIVVAGDDTLLSYLKTEQIKENRVFTSLEIAAMEGGQSIEGLQEAEYQGRNVPLGKPMSGDVKKSKVYVKGPKGNVVKVNFGDKKMKIKKSNPARRKSFRARHNCENPGPRWKARYWSCRAW